MVSRRNNNINNINKKKKTKGKKQRICPEEMCSRQVVNEWYFVCDTGQCKSSTSYFAISLIAVYDTRNVSDYILASERVSYTLLRYRGWG